MAPSDVEDDLRRALTAVDENVAVPSAMVGRSRIRARKRRRRRAVAAAAAVVLVAAGAITVLTGSARRSEIATDPGDSAPTTVAATTTLVEGAGLLAAPDHPVLGRVFPVTAWTGRELVVWGGAESIGETQWHTDGAAYDPERRTWRELAPAPPEARSAHVGVWTGDELVVCCRRSPTGEAGGAAYDPDRDTWRLISTSLIDDAAFAAGVWTGTEVLIVGDDRAAAYDPSTDEWRELAAPPAGMWAPDVAWSGDRVYAWPTPSGGGNLGAAYDPERDVWTVLPEPPAESWPWYADIEWTGTELVVWGMSAASQSFPGPGALPVGARFDPGTGEWRAMANVLPPALGYDGNAGSQTVLWTGSELVVATGSLASGLQPEGSLLLAYDPPSDTWHRIGALAGPSFAPGMLMAGERLVVESQPMFVAPPRWTASTTSEPMVVRPVVTQAEYERAWWLRYFAVLEERELFDRITLADEVQIGVGDSFVVVAREDLADPTRWVVDGVDVLAPLRSLTQPDDVTVAVGPLSPCGGPVLGAPPGYQEVRRLALVPTEPSCSAGFIVEMFVGADGAVDAVRLDRPR